MGWLRHQYHKRFGRHGRFHLAVLLTIVVVTYVFVPWLAGLVDAIRGYGPAHYEPKDSTRQDNLTRPGSSPLPTTTGNLITDIVLVLLVVIVWMTIFSRGGVERG